MLHFKRICLKRYLLMCLVLWCEIALSLGISEVNAQPIEAASALSPNQSVALSGEISAWRERAQAWYRDAEITRRRRQMREMSRPLKRACYYCHTRSFKGYVDETYLISLQMMAISAEQGVSCAECHQGRRALTALGAKSLIQWRYAAESGRDCRDCHRPKGRFRELTAEGAQARAHLIHTVETRGVELGIAPQLLATWLKELRARSLSPQNVEPASAQEAEGVVGSVADPQKTRGGDEVKPIRTQSLKPTDGAVESPVILPQQRP